MEIKEIIQNQREFFNTNSTKPVRFRVTQLKRLKHILQQNEDLLNDAIYKDFKKSVFDNYSTELGLIYNEIDRAVRKLHKWVKPKRVRTDLANLPGRSYTIADPLGVSLIIGAWNYPYNISLIPVVAAMAAGNCVVLKPSELPANASSAMARLINQNFDAKYLVVVEGGIPETTELLNQKFDKILFTGSTKVGKIVYQKAAENLTPVTLELGGKSPVFFTQNANLKIGVKRLVWSKFLNAGQTCIAPDYVLAHSSIKKQFIERLKEEITQSSYSTENGNYVQIINDRNVKRLEQLIDSTKVIIGGEVNKEDRLISPTVMDNVTLEDAVMQEEIFGPILPVIGYDNLQDAIDQVKSLPRPLSVYVYSQSKAEVKQVFNQLSFGTAMVNDSTIHFANSNFGFGGVGESGFGSYHGKTGFDTFSHFKSIIKKPTWFELNIKYHPLTSNKLKLVKWLLKW